MLIVKKIYIISCINQMMYWTFKSMPKTIVKKVLPNAKVHKVSLHEDTTR